MNFFFPVHRHPHPRSVIFNMVPYLLYTVFSMYTLCKSRAFLQNYLILSFQFFQAEVKCYFLILGWLLEKKSFFSVYFAFYLIICCYLQQDVTFTTTTKRSLFLLDRLILCASLLDKSVHCEFVDMSRCGSCYSVNCKLCSGFLRAFYLEVLPGTHVTQRLWLVFHFLIKLSAACAHWAVVKDDFFIVPSLGKKTNPGLLGCSNIHINMGMTKKLSHSSRL